MENIINDINNLKEKINNEIESLKYYKELRYICDALTNEINSYNYSLDNNLSLKKYKAFLEVFLEQKIAYINSLIANKQNNSVFDNRLANDYQKLIELKESISTLLTYIANNFPVIGKEISIEYERINNHYNNELLYTIDSSKRRFNNDIGISNEPIFSIYIDTSSVLKAYYNSLNAFKIAHVDSIKIFVDNDIKVKELFKRAYDTLKDPKVVEAVKGLESNYLNELNKCNESLSANTNILLIQENMIQNGLQLDKIIELEKEKNSIYNMINNITLNYNNIDELLKIEEYVTINNFFNEEFYKVLYFLVEKEKYVYKKFKVKPIIYNKISDRSRIVLEKMFLGRIKELDDSLKEEIIIELKKNGYINVLDREYEDFFNKSKFTIQTDYMKDIIVNDDSLECKHVTKGIREEHYDIINKKTGKVVDHIYAIKRSDDLFKRIGDIYRFSGRKVNITGSKNVDYYYDSEGKRIKLLHDNLLIIDSVLDFYIAGNMDSQIIFDKNFNKIMDYRGKDNSRKMLVDYKKEQILILDDNKKTFSLYDKDFQLIKEVSLEDVLDLKNNHATVLKYDEESKSIVETVLSSNYDLRRVTVSFNDDVNMFNEGIFSVLIITSGNKYICYFDIENMKRIDLFTIKHDSSMYGYSEGLYPYYEYDKYLLGYKNINGDVILEPNYLQAHPFVNGCAKVVNDCSVEYGFINHQGKYQARQSFLGYDTVLINLNKPKNQYEVCYVYTNDKFIVKAFNTYIIDCDDKIMDINFEKEKIMIK